MASDTGTLPFLPGHAFKDASQKQFGRTSTFNHTNGYSVPKSAGNPGEMLTASEIDEMAAATARLTYGSRVRGAARQPDPIFVPAHVAFDKKVLLFTGYMKSTVHESADETYRVRYFKIFYYLEDDTMSITEPEVENSGLQQGAFLKRQRIPRDATGITYHWKDLNLGINLPVYGKVIRITNCNEWTRKYMIKEGIALNPAEEHPEDPYLIARLPTDKPNNTHATPSDFDSMKQFLVLDRKVLRFYAVWDDRHNMFGELREFILHYYLVDDTVEIREVHTQNDGRDPFPILLARQRVPRNFKAIPMEFPTCVMELSQAELSDLLNPADFAIGKSVHVFGRDFLLYNVDDFTKNFYRQNFGATDADFTPIDVAVAPPAAAMPALPPHTGIGSAEDAYLSCVTIAPKAPLGQKSLPKLLKYDNSALRYEATLDTEIPEDKLRSFIISYRLADDMVSVYEPPQHNSGTTQGKFLTEIRLQLPGSNPDMPTYYEPKHFFIGARIGVYNRTFVITDCDAFVQSFMNEHPHLFTPEAMSGIEAHFAGKQ